MPRKKKRAGEFRYETGEARVPWLSVGEFSNVDDVMRTVEYLVGPGADGEAYRRRLEQVRKGVAGLVKAGRPAGTLTIGDRVGEVEKAARRYLKVKHAVFLTNATAGFEIAYKLAGLQPGDEVIVPAITFVATMAYPLAIGAKVVLADVDPRTVNLDPADVERKITKRTRMIVPVHIGGWPADMDPIMQLARKHKLVVLEDAAHAYGAMYKGRRAGTIGHFGAFSFHQVKNITAYGEGGLLVTNTKYGKQFAKCRFLGVDPTRKVRHWVYDVTAIEGMRGPFAPGNHSVTEIQAVGLRSQMSRNERIIATRRRHARTLNRRFAKVPGLVGAPMDEGKTRGTFHLYLLQVDPDELGANVQALKAKLKDRGVTQIPHFCPLYKYQIMKRLGYDTQAIQESCPVAEDLFENRFTHLPVYGLSDQQIAYMADAVVESVEELRRGR